MKNNYLLPHVQNLLGTRPGLATQQPRYEAPSDLQVKLVQTQ